MFFPEGRIRVFLYGQPADMRKSYDGLYGVGVRIRAEMSNSRRRVGSQYSSSRAQ